VGLFHDEYLELSAEHRRVRAILSAMYICRSRCSRLGRGQPWKHLGPCRWKSSRRDESGEQNAAPRKSSEVDDVLASPSWSVSSLMPVNNKGAVRRPIAAEQLHHLLRLSALPPPTDSVEENRMLSTLASQLHFVEDIQRVDTRGVEPLYSLRDETAEGELEAELGLDALKDALAQEQVQGRYHKRIRRRTGETRNEDDQESWDPLAITDEKVGRYFVVKRGNKD
jgi:Asp-tRNA(Asn)/Glu-tRNA(Gln) amidotransferase C subunit